MIIILNSTCRHLSGIYAFSHLDSFVVFTCLLQLKFTFHFSLSNSSSSECKEYVVARQYFFSGCRCFCEQIDTNQTKKYIYQCFVCCCCCRMRKTVCRAWIFGLSLTFYVVSSCFSFRLKKEFSARLLYGHYAWFEYILLIVVFSSLNIYKGYRQFTFIKNVLKIACFVWWIRFDRSLSFII